MTNERKRLNVIPSQGLIQPKWVEPVYEDKEEYYRQEVAPEPEIDRR